MKQTEKQMMARLLKVATFQYIMEVVFLIALVVAALLSGSLLAWLDLVESVYTILHAVLIAVLSSKLRKNLKYEYNYGSEKMEAITSLTCNVFWIVALFVLMYNCANNIIHVQQPNSLTVIMLPITVCNVLLDIIITVTEYRMKNAFPDNRVIQEEWASNHQSLLFDTVTMVAIFIVYFFRKDVFAHYLTPAVTAVMCIVSVVLAFIAIKASVWELMDKTADEQTQMKILGVLNRNYDRYKQFYNVKTRKSGKKVFIDIDVDFEEEKTFGEISCFAADLRRELEEKLPGCEVNLILSDEDTQEE